MDALALLELDSVARGYRVLDALVKEAPVTVVQANLVEPGKFLILFGGGVGEVDSAYKVGREAAEGHLADEVRLPYVDPRVWTGLRGTESVTDPDCIGVIEGRSVAGVIEACDASLKMADVGLCGLRVVVGLGGKAFYVVHGPQHDVEAAIDAGAAVLTRRGKLLCTERIARPHPEFVTHVLRPAPFGGS